MNKYLYGASVQGIQGFIFQTNALREIAGASELVEQICTAEFAKAIHSNADQLDDDQNAIVTAAGNIKYLFDDEQKCRDVVKNFPKTIMEFAPGITISQAVVLIEDGKPVGKDHLDLLERKLKTQRNKPFRPYDLGLLGINRSRKTGLPAYEEKNIKGTRTIIDKGVSKKIATKQGRVASTFFNSTENERIPWEMNDMTSSKGKSYSWLAVIHADGNNMGNVIQNLAEQVKNLVGNEFVSIFRRFSLALNNSTKNAANQAYKKTLESLNLEANFKLPFRPIVIGGDDLTIICRADLALDFTKLFLKYFEVETKKNFADLGFDFLDKGLTACAGIAYIKESYPFHYGYQLAETLCSEAKKNAKQHTNTDKLTPSCLLFHKVQDSFIENYKKIKERELKAGNIFFDYGPYYLNENKYPTIDKLKSSVAQLEVKEGNAIKSHLRQWLTDLHTDQGLASQKIDRLVSVADQQSKIILDNLGLPKAAVELNPSPVYDWLTIHSINQGGY